MADVEKIDDEFRESARRAVALLQGRGEKVTLAAVQRTAGGNRAKLSALLKAYRANDLPTPGGVKSGVGRWGQGGEPASRGAAPAPEPGSEEEAALRELITQARTTQQLRAVTRRVMADVAAGTLTSAQGQALKALLVEMRQHEAPTADPTSVQLVSARAMKIARAFDLILDDTRAQRIEDLVAAEFAEHMAETPNEDFGGAAAQGGAA